MIERVNGWIMAPVVPHPFIRSDSGYSFLGSLTCNHREMHTNHISSVKQMSLERHIYDIGSRMVACNRHCSGIALDLSEGIVPKCLLLETEGRADAQGIVIVGINPGRSGARERNFYLANGPTYEQVVNYWRTHVSHRHKYYTRLRNLSTELGFSGPILWTELVKCESAPDQRKPPLQTFRTCTRTYLQEELKDVLGDWPLIAVGREAYKALAYRFANRAIIGVPHPTGSFGHFHRLFDTGRLLPEVKAQTKELWDGEIGKAVWLTAETPSRQSAAG